MWIVNYDLYHANMFYFKAYTYVKNRTEVKWTCVEDHYVWSEDHRIYLEDIYIIVVKKAKLLQKFQSFTRKEENILNF